MSNEVFPTLPGLTFGTERSYEFDTLIAKNVSQKEVRETLTPFPRRAWLLNYEFLRQTGTLNEMRTLAGFFLRHRGDGDDFLFNDRDDNAVTNAGLGTGNGTRTAWQMVRPFESFVEPIRSINTITQVRLNGTPTTAYSLSQWTGVITFNSAPANGAAITADFTYYWRARFDDGKLSIREFLRRFYERRSLRLIEVKV